jgi:hypothetical protein
VLTTDIPGVEYGTLAHRIEGTVLRVLPQFIKRRITVLPGPPPAADVKTQTCVPEHAPARRATQLASHAPQDRSRALRLPPLPCLPDLARRGGIAGRNPPISSCKSWSNGRVHRSERVRAAAAPASAARYGPPDGAPILRRAARRRPDLPRGGQQRGAGVGCADARDGRRRSRACAARHRPYLGAHAGRRRGGRGGAARPEQRYAIPYPTLHPALSAPRALVSSVPCTRCSLAAGVLASGHAMWGVLVIKHRMPVSRGATIVGDVYWATLWLLRTIIGACNCDVRAGGDAETVCMLPRCRPAALR